MKKRSIYLLISLIATIFVLTGCGANTSMYDKNDTDRNAAYEEMIAYMHNNVSNNESLNINDAETTDITIVETETKENVSIETETKENVSIETETKENVSIETETTNTTTVEPETNIYTTVSKNPTDILYVASLHASCEMDVSNGYVDIDSSHNPYDVIWDYGIEYQAYIDACDWTLVWDYDYYINTFPMLAELYHYDKTLLLEHFQTVGIHEGRQGSANFNIDAFRTNSNCYDYNDKYAAYYLDYMLNYDNYTSINTKRRNDGALTYVQYTILYTAAQKRELITVNRYRNDLNIADLHINAELTCFANYRCHLNLTEGYYAHEWFKLNNYENAFIYNHAIVKTGMIMNSISENCIEGDASGFPDYYNCADAYAASPSHYAAMVSAAYDDIGVSHIYRSQSLNRACQFDMFIEYVD